MDRDRSHTAEFGRVDHTRVSAQSEWIWSVPARRSFPFCDDMLTSRTFDRVIQRVGLKQNRISGRSVRRRLSELIECCDFEVLGIRSSQTHDAVELTDLPRVLADRGDAMATLTERFRTETGRPLFGHHLQQHPFGLSERSAVETDDDYMCDIQRNAQRHVGKRDLTGGLEVATRSLSGRRVDRQDAFAPVEFQFTGLTGDKFLRVVNK